VLGISAGGQDAVEVESADRRGDRPIRLSEHSLWTSTRATGREAPRSQYPRVLAQELWEGRTILEGLLDGVITVTVEGNLKHANQPARTMLGWERAVLLGKPLHDELHRQGGARALCPGEDCPVLRALISAEEPVSGEDEFMRRDGSVFPVEYRIVPLRDRHMRMGAALAFHDISDRRQLQAELRSAQADARATALKLEEQVRALRAASRLASARSIGEAITSLEQVVRELRAAAVRD
jgi:PAS domain S-box-containing protein